MCTIVNENKLSCKLWMIISFISHNNLITVLVYDTVEIFIAWHSSAPACYFSIIKYVLNQIFKIWLPLMRSK